MVLRRTVIGLLAAPALVSGCADSDPDYANNPRPPSPINVTAAVTDRQVTISPEEFGAGPVIFIISNQTDQAQEVTLETDEIAGSGPGLKQTTSPINPNGTATLKVDIREGTYEVRAGDGIRPAELKVGEQRESAQNQLLQP